MISFLQDDSKFRMVTQPMGDVCRSVEDRINRFLLKLKSLKILNDSSYNELHASGSGPGILYGKPKSHKSDFSTKFQYRPILAAYNLASYKLAKFLVPLLSPLTSNQYTLQNSKLFAEQIQLTPNADKLFMASFDIESLFTNIPLSETINIILQKFFPSPNDTYNGFNKSLFKTMLELAVNNTYFIFNQSFYQQTEGMGMGSPLGPSFANVLKCHLEETWLEKCPPEFKPSSYYRYVDDTFLLFREEQHSQLFFDYLNSKHPNIRFTKENESKGALPFLDVTVRRSPDGFSTSVYRKPTFSGLGTSFFSYCSKKFKLNSIRTLVNRAYNISSSTRSFCMEISFIKSFFHINGYPSKLIKEQVESFISKKLDFRPSIPDVPRKPFYFTLPYFGHKSIQLSIQISKIIQENFFLLEPHAVQVNGNKIGNIFSYKDKLPLGLRSSVIYKYCCPHECGSAYVGSTVRTLETRIAEHRGVSVRTNKTLASRKASSIRAHHSSNDKCGGAISPSQFVIVDGCRGAVNLRILESLYIIKTRPNLNEMNSAFPLKIVNH